LDAGTPVRLAGRSLVAIDGLPVGGRDQLRLAGGQPVGQLVGVVVGEVRAFAGAGQVVQQGVDGVLGVLLIGADHTGRPALDPPDDVFVAAAVHPAAGVGDGRVLVVE